MYNEHTLTSSCLQANEKAQENTPINCKQQDVNKVRAQEEQDFCGTSTDRT